MNLRRCLVVNLRRQLQLVNDAGNAGDATDGLDEGPTL
jgi:hypothetical protein